MVKASAAANRHKAMENTVFMVFLVFVCVLALAWGVGVTVAVAVSSLVTVLLLLMLVLLLLLLLLLLMMMMVVVLVVCRLKERFHRRCEKADVSNSQADFAQLSEKEDVW